jgi:hypothetical protein
MASGIKFGCLCAKMYPAVGRPSSPGPFSRGEKGGPTCPGSVSRDLLPDSPAHLLGLPQQFLVANPQHAQSMISRGQIPTSIFLPPLSDIVDAPVQLHDQAGLRAEEIGDVTARWGAVVGT